MNGYGLIKVIMDKIYGLSLKDSWTVCVSFKRISLGHFDLKKRYCYKLHIYMCVELSYLNIKILDFGFQHVSS